MTFCETFYTLLTVDISVSLSNKLLEKATAQYNTNVHNITNHSHTFTRHNMARLHGLRGQSLEDWPLRQSAAGQ